jgi:hypothetical protein
MSCIAKFCFTFEVQTRIIASYILHQTCLSQFYFMHSLCSLVGVSLQLQGQTVLNNSLVNLADLLYQDRSSADPTNDNDSELQTLMCITDLEDCCETPVRGNWYYPNGSVVGYNRESVHVFQSNRGQYEKKSGSQIIYGSVRIWHRYTPPAAERGLFHCELPDANGVNQSLYVNICELSIIYHISCTVKYSMHFFFNSAI